MLFITLVISILFTIPFWLGYFSYKPKFPHFEYYATRVWYSTLVDPPISDTSLLGLWYTGDLKHFDAKTFVLRDGLYIDHNTNDAVFGFSPPDLWTTLP